MKTSGWVFLALAWGFVTFLVVFCSYGILKKKPLKRL